MSAVLLTIGGLICALNFYLSFVRVPMLRWMGRSIETKHTSGVPLIGSVLVILAWVAGLDFAGAQIVAWLLVLIDTGGPHWFIFSLASQGWTPRGRSSA
jgi:hypothetical protein